MLAQAPPRHEGASVIPRDRRRVGWRLRIAHLIAEFTRPDLTPNAFGQMPFATRDRYLRLADCVIGYLAEEMRDGN